LRNIIEIVATRFHIVKLQCTKFDVGRGSASEPNANVYILLIKHKHRLFLYRDACSSLPGQISENLQN